MEKRSNEALIWPLFAVGGELTALITPIMILVTGIIIPAGMFSGALSYDRMLGILSNPFWGLVLAFVISLSAWHALYRLYRTLFDLGVRKAIGICSFLCIGSAIFITVASFAVAIMLAAR
jgi:fumarate reductase subunit D